MFGLAAGTVAAGIAGAAIDSVGQGNPKKFSAKEIQRQADRLEEQRTVLLAKLNGAADTCESIASVVRSEDSNLANAWKQLADTFKTVKSKYDGALNTMVTRMNTYALKTIASEEVIEKGANAIGNALDEVASFLQNIDL